MASADVVRDLGSGYHDLGRTCRSQAATSKGDVTYLRACSTIIDDTTTPPSSYFVFGVAKYSPAQLEMIEAGTDPGTFEVLIRVDFTHCAIDPQYGGCA